LFLLLLTDAFDSCDARVSQREQLQRTAHRNGTELFAASSAEPLRQRSTDPEWRRWTRSGLDPAPGWTTPQPNALTPGGRHPRPGWRPQRPHEQQQYLTEWRRGSTDAPVGDVR